MIKAKGGNAADIQPAVQAKGVVTAITTFHHAAFVRCGAAGLEARAIQFGGEDFRGQANVVADLVVVGQVKLVVVHRDVVVLAAFVQALLAAWVFAVLLQREVAFIVALAAFAKIGGRGGELVAVVELQLEAAVKVVELVFFHVEGAVGLFAGVAEDHAQRAFRAAVADVALARTLVAGGQFNTGLWLGSWPQVAEVDDAVIVQRTMNDLPGALEHLDLFQALQRRRVVGAGIEIGAVVDGGAVLQQQHLA